MCDAFAPICVTLRGQWPRAGLRRVRVPRRRGAGFRRAAADEAEEPRRAGPIRGEEEPAVEPERGELPLQARRQRDGDLAAASDEPVANRERLFRAAVVRSSTCVRSTSTFVAPASTADASSRANGATLPASITPLGHSRSPSAPSTRRPKPGRRPRWPGHGDGGSLWREHSSDSHLLKVPGSAQGQTRSGRELPGTFPDMDINAEGRRHRRPSRHLGYPPGVSLRASRSGGGRSGRR